MAWEGARHEGRITNLVYIPIITWCNLPRSMHDVKPQYFKLAEHVRQPLQDQPNRDLLKYILLFGVCYYMSADLLGFGCEVECEYISRKGLRRWLLQWWCVVLHTVRSL